MFQCGFDIFIEDSASEVKNPVMKNLITGFS